VSVYLRTGLYVPNGDDRQFNSVVCTSSAQSLNIAIRSLRCLSLAARQITPILQINPQPN
jgi:hypothetical protein